MKKDREAGDGALFLHVFRVNEGLGNACLMELPDGTCGVVDWGTQSPKALESLIEIVGGRRFRFVVASHAHADHTLGLVSLLTACAQRRIPIDRFIYPASTLHRSHAYLTKARLVARKCGIPMSSVAVDDFPGPAGEPACPYLAWAAEPPWEVRVLSPPLSDVGESEVRALERRQVPGNETSLVVLFRYAGPPALPGAGRALLPGDATAATLRFARRTARRSPGLELDNQAFVVPHHGSRHNFPPWLEDHLHGLAVVSSPTASRHHPAADVLERLSRKTCRDVPRLFCTSYAGCCFERFGDRARGPRHAFVRPGGCFGDIVVRVPPFEPATLERASLDGEARRAFGYCGNARQATWGNAPQASGAEGAGSGVSAASSPAAS